MCPEYVASGARARYALSIMRRSVGFRVSLNMLIVAFGLLAAAVTPLRAQEGLYAPQLDGSEALVRVANLTDVVRARLDVGPLRFSGIASSDVTAYRPVVPDFFMVGGRANGVMITPEPSSFTTIVLTDEKIVPFSDRAHGDPLRSQIVLYNLGDRPLTLEAVAQSTRLIGPVSSGQAADIVVNAIEVELAVVDGTGTSLHQERISLVRGQSYGFFAAPDGTVRVVQARVETR